MEFVNPPDVSAGAYPDAIKVVFNEPDLLIRESDGVSITYQTEIVRDTPKIIDYAGKEQYVQAAESVK